MSSQLFYYPDVIALKNYALLQNEEPEMLAHNIHALFDAIGGCPPWDLVVSIAAGERGLSLCHARESQGAQRLGAPRPWGQAGLPAGGQTSLPPAHPT